MEIWIFEVSVKDPTWPSGANITSYKVASILPGLLLGFPSSKLKRQGDGSCASIKWERERSVRKAIFLPGHTIQKRGKV